ncbi:MAG: ABC transporter ATP-binding protein [Croceitalea sp.]|nr:ABC transporter ATP-binding protein [Croceitalea sp.]NNM18351.1 ABC transporter ATP-binding protein [Croceitalea sp.]
MLKVDNIDFSYRKTPVLAQISFGLEQGKHLAVMGESGSGKSTLLKAIYGLIDLVQGEITWNKKKVLGPSFNLIPGHENMKYVSQNFDLMPYTTVTENIGQFLSVYEQDTHQSRIDELLEVIEMTDYAKTKVKNLSGGQQQRVALARALAQEPALLLLDEPFSNIDQFKKNELRHRLFPYLKEKQITVITATHDPNDVLSFSDLVLVLKAGQKIALDQTLKLYHSPKEKYVASLFGKVNELPVKLLKNYTELDTKILVYPHEFELSSDNGIKAIVTRNFFKGGRFLIESQLLIGGPIWFYSKTEIREGAQVFLNVSLELIGKRLKDKKMLDDRDL